MFSSAFLRRSVAASLYFALSFCTFAFSQTFTVLHTFQCSTDGGAPFSGLVRGKDGNLYGTASIQGSTPAADGTVYKVTPSGQFKVIHTFTGGNDGLAPGASVIQDAAGNLYGTTSNGGPSNAGVVWKITPAGHESVIYTFTAGSDGGYPFSDLIRDSKGNLYGTTFGGGDSACSSYLNGCGTVFKIDNTGHETVLHSFEGGLDGEYPYAGLVMDSARNLYGATAYDDGADFEGGGQVFEIDGSGNKTVVYDFTPGTSGGDTPTTDLTFAPGHVLYGTAAEGGDMNACSGFGCGVVYRIDSNNVATTIHTFEGQPSSGGAPTGPLARDAAGNLYGVTFRGGANDLGVVFKLDPSGNETLLHSFTGSSDGSAPHGRLYLDSQGNIYGTASASGSGCGTIFKITP